MAGRTSIRGAAGRVICSGFVVFSPLIELRFLGSWSGHICWSWTLFLNRKPGTGLNSVLYVLALCLGKNDSVPGAYEIPPMIVSLFSLLILIRVCREILSHLIWGVFLWQLHPTADMIDFSESATKYWGFSVFWFCAWSPLHDCVLVIGFVHWKWEFCVWNMLCLQSFSIYQSCFGLGICFKIVSYPF